MRPSLRVLSWYWIHPIKLYERFCRSIFWVIVFKTGIITNDGRVNVFEINFFSTALNLWTEDLISRDGLMVFTSSDQKKKKQKNKNCDCTDSQKTKRTVYDFHITNLFSLCKKLRILFSSFSRFIHFIYQNKTKNYLKNNSHSLLGICPSKTSICYSFVVLI